MEKRPTDEIPEPPERQEPPPFAPDPDLITHLERGDKPTEEQVRAVTKR